jgi:hypothetical protein
MKAIAISYEPGGANAVAATVAVLRSLGVEVAAYAKGFAIRQFQRLSVDCQPVGNEPPTFLASLTGDILLLGTSEYCDPLEREAVLWAQQRQIPSIAIMDYWANYRLRFQSRTEPELEPIFPDLFTAIDERCAEGMVADGLPPDRIHILGQPYFAWLIDRQKNKKSPVETVQNIMFASQPGANEIEILKILLEVLASYTTFNQLLVRFHPIQESCCQSIELLERSGLPFAIDDSTDVLTTLQQQDKVLGITSIVLIEAALMGVPAGSLTIGVEDTLMTNRLSLTMPLTSPEQLQAFLFENKNQSCSHDFIEQQRGADERVAKFCYNLIQEKYV